MKFRAPPHCRVVIHNGVTLPVASDGSVEAPESEAAHLLAHGIRPLAPAAPQSGALSRPSAREIEAMSRGDLIAALGRLGRPAAPSARTAELRRALRQALTARA
jgi:hypothetical protein